MVCRLPSVLAPINFLTMMIHFIGAVLFIYEEEYYYHSTQLGCLKENPGMKMPLKQASSLVR